MFVGPGQPWNKRKHLRLGPESAIVLRFLELTSLLYHLVYWFSLMVLVQPEIMQYKH